MSAPRVYAAISAITAELAETGIAKAHVNARDQYSYRSIDDVTQCLAPLLAKHRLCILPRVLERAAEERRGLGDMLLISVSVRVAFDFVSGRDGSTHTIEAYGESLDNGDKGTSKAITAAFKQAVLQAFCVPIAGNDDADAVTHRLVAQKEVPDPDQGWDQWAFDIQDMIRICETTEAVDRVQATYRSVFQAASKRRPDIYKAIGQVIQARRQLVAPKIGEQRQTLGSAGAALNDDGKSAAAEKIARV